MRVLVWIFCLLLVSPVAAQTKPPEELLTGYSKGYATRSVCNPKTRVATFSHNGKVLLTLKGIAAQKWQDTEAFLGPCYRDRPSFQVTSSKGTKATIYRFRSGVIVAYNNHAYALDWPMVMRWEILGGYNGKMGLPTTDTLKFRIVPEPKAIPA